MKKIIISLIVMHCAFTGTICMSQTIFWSAPFNAGHGWTLNTSTGANSASSNWWYVSCQEDGRAATECGTGCVTGDPSLHLGSRSVGDIGAAYDAMQTTNRRAASPNINTAVAGLNAITMRFNFIHYGQGATDRCQLYYSINGGTSWLILENPIPKAPCCGGCDGQNQGQWTARSYVLPATCNNIANFRIAFNWINDGSGGTDPSFGVDDITLEYNAPMPVSWLSFDGEVMKDAILLSWNTATEINNDYFEVQRSADGVKFSTLGKVKGSGNSNQVNSYSFRDTDTRPGVFIYRLKQVDFNGDFHFSEMIAVSHDDSSSEYIEFVSNMVAESLDVAVYVFETMDYSVEITDASGKSIFTDQAGFQKGKNLYSYDASSLSQGVYYFMLRSQHDPESVTAKKFVKL